MINGLTIIILSIILFCSSAKAEEQEKYGPPNLLKTMKTPFSGSVIDRELRKKWEAQRKKKNEPISLGAISLNSKSSGRRKISLARKLLPPKLYLPERMTIGKSEKFVIKGKAGMNVAIAMADKDTGARPIMGHKLRLGADRKLVAVGTIPSSGVLEIYIGTPIQGDLIGQKLFFEAALWSKEDLSDTEFAQTVAPGVEKEETNGVLIAGEIIQKRGVRIVPDSAIPLGQRQTQGTSLSSGQP